MDSPNSRLYWNDSVNVCRNENILDGGLTTQILPLNHHFSLAESPESCVCNENWLPYLFGWLTPSPVSRTPVIQAGTTENPFSLFENFIHVYNVLFYQIHPLLFPFQLFPYTHCFFLWTSDILLLAHWVSLVLGERNNPFCTEEPYLGLG